MSLFLSLFLYISSLGKLTEDIKACTFYLAGNFAESVIILTCTLFVLSCSG